MEDELEVQISEELWQDALDRIHSSSICMRHTIIQFKTVHRLHWFKVKLAKFTSKVDVICDRCRTEQASVLSGKN